MDVAISIQDLTVKHGSMVAVRGLNLSVRRGEVFGFLGPNGAGKSTTIRALMGLHMPDAGVVHVLGKDLRTAAPESRRHVGFLPGDLALFGHASGRDTLKLFADLYGVAPVDREMVLETLRFSVEALSRPLRNYSTGMRQAIGIAAAFQHRPDVLVLDEPTTGLDPLARDAFLQLVVAARSRGATVFLSSHVLDEVDKVADRVAIIAKGTLRRVDSVAGIRAHLPRRIRARRADGTEWVFESAGDIQTLLVKLRDMDLSDVEIGPVPLETIFADAVTRGDA